MADIPRSPETNLLAYADDTVITATAGSRPRIRARLQRHLNSIGTWMDRWRLRVNPQKSQVILFGNNRKRLPRERLKWKDTPLDWSPKAKYLGITFDARLNWKDHVISVRRKATIQARLLYPLVNRHSRLNMKTKLTVYKLYLRPVLTYAAPAWATVALEQNLRPLLGLENRWLKQYTNAGWYIRNTTLRRDTGLEELQTHMRNLASKHFLNSDTSTNRLIRQRHAAAPPGSRHLLPRNAVPGI